MIEFTDLISAIDLELPKRLVSAVLLGFVLGFEREITNKFAGLRTHMLVCAGACVFTILSLYGFPPPLRADGQIANADPARVAAQIITGIGFIGGGTVLRHGNTVLGLTTASTLWMAAAIGMACGVGRIDIAVFTTILSVLVLVLIRVFETRVLAKDLSLHKTVLLKITCPFNVSDRIYELINSHFSNIQHLQRKKEDSEVHIWATIQLSQKMTTAGIYEIFKEYSEITSINVGETEKK